MGQEILYCYRCQRRIVGAEFGKGQAYQVGNRVSCSSCAADLLQTLSSKEREALLAQMFKATQHRQGTSTSKLKIVAEPAPSTSRRQPTARIALGELRTPLPPRAPVLGIAIGVGGALAAIVVLLLVFSGGNTAAPDTSTPVSKERPARVSPSPPVPSRESAQETEREAGARAELKKARDFAKARPEDLDGQVKAWEGAVRAAEKTGVLEEAKKELGECAARRREAIARELAQLEIQVRPKLAGEEFKVAGDVFQAARVRHDLPEWTDPIDRRLREIHDGAVQMAAPLRERAIAATERRAPAEAEALVERIARWGYPEIELEVRRAIEAAAPPAVVVPPLSGGLVARWTLAEGSGVTAADASGKWKASFKGSAGWTAGRSGSAVRLDGSGAHIELPNAPELDRLQGGSYTISIWFKPDAFPQDPNEKTWGGAAALVMKGPFREGLVYIAGGHFLLIHWLAGGKWTSAGSWAETSGPGNWYHVVGVVDRGAGQDRVFVNGLLKGTESWAKDSPAQEFWTERWTLGKVKYGGENDYPAKGAFSDLRIYDRALEASEVAALHTSGPGSGK